MRKILIDVNVDNIKVLLMRAVTINQEYEPRIVSKHNSERAAEIFPDLIQSEVNPLQSIGIVLSQALSTKDKQAIK